MAKSTRGAADVEMAELDAFIELCGFDQAETLQLPVSSRGALHVMTLAHRSLAKADPDQALAVILEVAGASNVGRSLEASVAFQGALRAFDRACKARGNANLSQGWGRVHSLRIGAIALRAAAPAFRDDRPAPDKERLEKGLQHLKALIRLDLGSLWHETAAPRELYSVLRKAPAAATQLRSVLDGSASGRRPKCTGRTTVRRVAADLATELTRAFGFAPATSVAELLTVAGFELAELPDRRSLDRWLVSDRPLIEARLKARYLIG